LWQKTIEITSQENNLTEVETAKLNKLSTAAFQTISPAEILAEIDRQRQQITEVLKTVIPSFLAEEATEILVSAQNSKKTLSLLSPPPKIQEEQAGTQINDLITIRASSSDSGSGIKNVTCDLTKIVMPSDQYISVPNDKNSSDTNYFDSSNILVLIYRFRKVLGIVVVAAVIASVIFSAPFFIPPKFKSTVTVFPTSNATAKSLLMANIYGKQDIMSFGEDEQVEQLLQILHSDEIRNRVIQKFNLMDHYKIKPDETYKHTMLGREFDENISFRRTEFMSVEIKVMDTDPQMAADIANEISNLIDSVKNKMLQERALKGLEIIKKEFLSLEDEIWMMEDSMKVLRGKGVFEYESQSEVLNQQLAVAMIENNAKAERKIQARLDSLAKYGGAYMNLQDKATYYRDKLSDLKVKYQEARADAENKLPQKFVVNQAVQAEKKTYPVRWLIVVVSTLAAFIVTLLTILIVEKLKTIRFETEKK